MNGDKVFVEIGVKKVFAGAIDWPGWCRIGKDESAALQALIDYGPRYARILHAQGISFQPPASLSDLIVIERQAGNATTDFGVPSIILDADSDPVDQVELERFQNLLRAYWQAFDSAVAGAEGKELRKGPRGGGREVDEISEHVLGADQAYLDRLAWKHKPEDGLNLAEAFSKRRQAVITALEAAERGDLPKVGPKGGIIWPPRYFVRRVAWHVLDHTWEIEDRVTP